MSIPRALAVQLLNISQVVLSSIEGEQWLDAKCGLLRMAAIIDVETDRSQEVERWKAVSVAGGTQYS